MVTKNLVLASCAAMVLSIATAQAGPCNTGDKSAQDAGSGPTPGNTGQTAGTVGSTNAEHPPTSTMNRCDRGRSGVISRRTKTDAGTAYGGVQQGQGVQSSGKTADQDC